MQLPLTLRYDESRDCVTDGVVTYSIVTAKGRNYRYIRFEGKQVALSHITANKALQQQLDRLLTVEGWEELERKQPNTEN